MSDKELRECGEGRCLTLVVVGRVKPSAWPSPVGLTSIGQSNQEFCVLNFPREFSRFSLICTSIRRNHGFNASLSPDGPSWKTWLTTGAVRRLVFASRFRLPPSREASSVPAPDTWRTSASSRSTNPMSSTANSLKSGGWSPNKDCKTHPSAAASLAASHEASGPYSRFRYE